MDPAPAALWSIAIGLAAGWSLPWWSPSRPAPAAPSHSLDCGCEAELRELLNSRELLEWWRLVALVLGLATGLLAICLVCAGLCVAGLCRCCWGGLRTGVSAGGTGVRVKVEPGPRARDDRLLELLAAAEVRR
jgi:hypothetical protein